MKLRVLQENFSKALSFASRFTSTKAQLPVLGNILLSGSGNKLLIASTNLEISFATKIGAKVDKEGEITVPARTIYDIVSNLPSGSLGLEAEKEQLFLKTTGFSSKISGMNASDFPSIPKGKEENAISLPAQGLAKAISQSVFAVSLDETRPILTGILFLFQKELLSLVATDGFRLSLAKVSLKKPSKNQKIILPRTAVSEVTRLQESEEEIFFSYKESENQGIFTTSDTTLSSRTIEGEFPDFESIIPEKSTLRASLDKEEFLRAIKLASPFARDSANIVKLSMKEDSLEVFAESSQSGNQKTSLDAKVEGEKFEIAFNYRFLEEFLHAAVGEEIRMELSSPSSPGVFRDSKDPDFLHLVMPVKIQT